MIKYNFLVLVDVNYFWSSQNRPSRVKNHKLILIDVRLIAIAFLIKKILNSGLSPSIFSLKIYCLWLYLLLYQVSCLNNLWFKTYFQKCTLPHLCSSECRKFQSWWNSLKYKKSNISNMSWSLKKWLFGSSGWTKHSTDF